jgi:DNA-binding NtrC family response regulator
MHSPLVECEKLNLLGQSDVFRAMLERVLRVANCDATVLIQGETGTGKELVGRAVHYLSRRRNGPFVPINCGAIPSTLIESELFGCVRGAFTDAREGRAGLIAQADHGTLLLDEVEAMSPQAQVAMLRFLQEHEYRPLGGDNRRADVRIVAVSNVDLAALAARGGYRRDFLFRLNVVVIDVPPLRERSSDAVLIAEAFLARLNGQHRSAPKRLHDSARRYLLLHSWPGNVRELENFIQREFLLGDGVEIHAPDGPRSPEPLPRSAEPSMSFREAKAQAVAEFERRYLMDVLASTSGNVTQAARFSGKERSRFTRLMKKHGIAAVEFRSRSPSA